MSYESSLIDAELKQKYEIVKFCCYFKTTLKISSGYLKWVFKVFSDVPNQIKWISIFGSLSKYFTPRITIIQKRKCKLLFMVLILFLLTPIISFYFRSCPQMVRYTYITRIQLTFKSITINRCMHMVCSTHACFYYRYLI